jgi:hypothetical protein
MNQRHIPKVPLIKIRKLLRETKYLTKIKYSGPLYMLYGNQYVRECVEFFDAHYNEWDTSPEYRPKTKIKNIMVQIENIMLKYDIAKGFVIEPLRIYVEE